MAVTYTTAVKTARMQAVADAIDASDPGVLQIGTTGMGTVLAEFTLAQPCGTAAAGVLTFDFDPDISDTSANNDGTAAAARIRNGDGTDVVTGLTVGTTGTDIVLDSVSITTGQTVTITAGTITHA
jgi:hypothetical protein